MEHFVSIEQLGYNDVMNLINRAIDYKQGLTNTIKGHVVNMFFENSTRTKTSFEMAEYHLGMHVINFDADHSSVKKGETLYDSLLTMKALGVNAAVIRHSDSDYYKPLMDVGIKIINAGSGVGEHPSQSLLDMMTIYEEFGQINGLTVAIAGDLSHSRVAMSNAKLLYRMGAEVLFVGPECYHEKSLEKWGRYVSMEEALNYADVMMLLRVQLERHTAEESLSQEEYHQLYGLNKDNYPLLKKNAIIMHPAPVNRNVEIADDYVECPQSRIVKQMENGVYMRMAILESVMGE